MGRLVDSILAAVGYKPSDRVADAGPPTGLDQTKQAPTGFQQENSKQTNLRHSTQSPAQSKEDVPEVLSNIKYYLYESFPRAAPKPQPFGTNKSKTDCLECKVIGVTTFGGMGLYCLYNALRITRPTKRQTIGTRLSFVTLSIPLFVTAAYRFFDLGVFSKEGRNKTVQEHLLDEINSGLQILGIQEKDKPAFIKKFEEEVEETRLLAEIEHEESLLMGNPQDKSKEN